MSETARSFSDVLPASVQNQVNRANDAIKALSTDPSQPAPKTDPNTPANPEKPTAQTVEGTPNEGHQPTVPPKSEDEQTWKERYDALLNKHNALQGKYNAEVPRLSKDVANLRNQVRALTEENTRLSKEAEEAKAAAKNAKPDTGKQPGTLDPDDYSSFGDDIVAVIKVVNELKDENAKLREQLSTKPKADTPKQTTPNEPAPNPAYDAFLDKVREGVPDFDALNTDPQLLNWLNTRNEKGIPYGQVFFDADQRMDHKKAIETFNIFKKDVLGIPMPTDSDEPGPKGDKPPTPPLSPPASVPPDSSAQATTPTGKMWTRAEISQFYRDVTAGKYNGQKELKASTEADIFAAQKDGRIRG